ncbi:hypothetical protein SAY86_028718 [Trapa natans]|uniref:Zinc finger PHD-type domain-containing protein n=1 Tax=Trapa natans TaxID=22666 RepID=A0AAN7M1V4_TRANT|nr:hypothetical protein SAY86_028718 [Trapa natans]
MKGRSQRLATANPPDDWVDDSWTVDCICGVNFDDGEEMVKCDECGVWVHTRCSRYVKEEELFACDKCKNKKNRNDIEETEVAQFLVELPTKTVRIESNYVAGGHAKKQPFGILTDIPMEKKVHVQGIPGGDPSLFNGLPSIFSQQLWKCTGYVPKKFNFQYKEFPCWDADKMGIDNVEEDNENAIDKGAGVLLSLSKERSLSSPATTFMGMRTKGDDFSNERKARPKEVKGSDSGDLDVRRPQNGEMKEKTLHRPLIVYSGKRKKEELAISKDNSAKKKARITDKGLDANGGTAHASEPVFRPTRDAKQLEFYEDRGAKSFRTDIRSVKSRNLKDTVAVETISDCRIAVSKTDEIPKNDVAASERAVESLCAELADHSQDFLVKDKVHDNVSQVESCAADVSNDGSPNKLIDLQEKNKVNESPETKDSHTCLEISTDKALGFQKPNVKIDAEDNSGASKNHYTSLSDACSPKTSRDTAKSTGLVTEEVSGICEGNDLVTSSSQCHGKKLIDVQNGAGLNDYNVRKDVEFSADTPDYKQDNKGSDGSTLLCKSLSEPKQISCDEELQKSGTAGSLPAPSSKLRLAISLGKSPSAGSSIVISKSSSSNKTKPLDVGNVLGDQAAIDFREHAPNTMKSAGKKHDVIRKTEEHSSSFCRTFHNSIPKGNATYSKDCAVSSSKSASAQNISANIGSSDSANMQNQRSFPAHNRPTVSGLSAKMGKVNNAAPHSSLKGSSAEAGHQPVVSNAPAGLSDEELALLLHQELNSSPRVPRVPRVRQASLPQLASQAASVLHTKRTSSSGAKDQNLVPKRKGRDSSRHNGTGPHKGEDVERKTGRTVSSDLKRQDKLSCGDASKREAKRSPTHMHNSKKNASSMSTSTNCEPSSSNETDDIKQYSQRASPLSNSDDDFTTDTPVYQTLPGLINEIMSRGRRMTYEELCDAVLPHWPSLRKHNGERYAYSSHSQAVLDCLRNRHEWAQLVDRGPKTNSSRKRRTESQEFEDEDSKAGSSRDVESKGLRSQREDFPKGKRKARRRRRLTLQGRGIQYLRRRRKADTDDEEASFSNSSEGSLFTEEDEIQGDQEASSDSEKVRDS